MSLSLALNNALSSLNVNQRSLSTLSQNIANANNPEYSRQIVTQQAVYLQGSGAGVSISDIGRKVDSYLQASVRDQGSIYGRTEVISDYTDRLQNLLGSPGSQNSIYSYASSFFNNMQSLAATPENASLRVSAVTSAQSTAQAMSSLSKGIYDMQYALDQDMSNAINTVNSNLRQIYSLNATITSSKLLGRSTSDLEDRRDSLLKGVSEVMDVQTYSQSNGAVNIFTAGGQSLVDQNLFQLSYIPAPSADFFANGNATNAINTYRTDEQGNISGTPNVLVTSGINSGVTTALTSGKLKGYLEMRDQQLPDVLSKIDMFAASMRDALNAVHNEGTGFPGPNSYTGTRLLAAEDYSEWTGSVRIAVLDQYGNPIASNYNNETTGMRPLTIDLSTLDTGNGAGNPSLQGIIDEINRNYGVPQNKIELGNINNVSLTLNNQAIPGPNNELNFDFQLDNISGRNGDFYVTGMQVLDDNSVDITSMTQDVPTVALAATGTYVTTADSNVVTVKTNTTSGFANGQIIYLSPPSSNVDGIDSGKLGGFFTISNVTTTGFDISIDGNADAGGSFDHSNVIARPSYSTSITGTNTRTTADGTLIANIAANPTARFYTVKAGIATRDANGNVSTSTVTYRIDNQAFNTQNYRYAATAATGDGTIVVPNNATPALRAVLVDEKGNELPVINNQYTTAQKGYLKIIAGNSNNVVSIDSLDSVENGIPNGVPPTAATNRGFSHYFELNNLFTQNRTTGVVDDVRGSAENMAVNKAIAANVNLIALGSLTQSPASSDPNVAPFYTYQRTIGDNSIAQKLANFGTNILTFSPAGDLGTTSLSLTAYAGQIISTTATKATNNKSDMDNAKLLLDGFNTRNDSARGVNLDEELANTIIYQNAYSASARIITVVNEFFQSLLDSIN